MDSPSGIQFASSVPFLIEALQLTGTFVFAVSGAILGMQRGLDIFGVLVLAFVTAVFGGVIRDLMIGAIPPEAIASWHALAIALIAGLLTFYGLGLLEKVKEPVQLFDAVGLALFAVAGTQKALAYGVMPVMAAVLGMISGIGGGMLRDVLVVRMPIVLYADIYAVAALAAALVVAFGSALAVPPLPAALLGVVLCVTLRVLAIYRGWRLPSSARSEPEP